MHFAQLARRNNNNRPDRPRAVNPTTSRLSPVGSSVSRRRRDAGDERQSAVIVAGVHSSATLPPSSLSLIIFRRNRRPLPRDRFARRVGSRFVVPTEKQRPGEETQRRIIRRRCELLTTHYSRLPLVLIALESSGLRVAISMIIESPLPQERGLGIHTNERTHDRGAAVSRDRCVDVVHTHTHTTTRRLPAR